MTPELVFLTIVVYRVLEILISSTEMSAQAVSEKIKYKFPGVVVVGEPYYFTNI